MIILKNVQKHYPSTNNNHEDFIALRGINLTINQGDIYGIIGRSGAGKSTLVRLLNKLEPVTSGEIHINGTEICSLKGRTLREFRQKIGMVFQHFNLLSSRTVYQNIAFPLELIKTPQAEIREKVTNLIKLVGLEGKDHAYPAQLSGGQKQRVGIARALVSEPEILLCDEVTSALDPETTTQILRLLKDINQKINLTLIVITHEMSVIKALCSHVAVLDQGEIVEDGSVYRIFTNPTHQTTKTLLKDEGATSLPTIVSEKLSSPQASFIVKLTFLDKESELAIISHASRDLNIDFNILAGNIETIQERHFGQLYLEVVKSHRPHEEIIEYFATKHIQIEEIANG